MKIEYVSVFSYLHGIHVLIRVVSRFFFFQKFGNFSKRGRLYTRETKMSQKIANVLVKKQSLVVVGYIKRLLIVYIICKPIYGTSATGVFLFGKYFLSFCPICQILKKIYIIARFLQQFFQQVAKI